MKFDADDYQYWYEERLLHHTRMDAEKTLKELHGLVGNNAHIDIELPEAPVGPAAPAVGDYEREAQNGYPSAPRIIQFGSKVFKVSPGNVLPAFSSVRPYCWYRSGLVTRQVQQKLDWHRRTYKTWKCNSQNPWTRSRSLKLAQRAGSFDHAPGVSYSYLE